MASRWHSERKASKCTQRGPAAAFANDPSPRGRRGDGYLNQFVVQDRILCLQQPENDFWECPQCRRIHLHAAGGICTECSSVLNAPRPLADNPPDDDYYGFLAVRAGDPFRLNCEELT